MKKHLLLSAIILISLIIAGMGVHHLYKINTIWSAQQNKVINGPVYYQNRVVVLLYHNFENKERGTAINPVRFRQHLDMLELEGFNVVSLQEVIRFVNHKGSLPPNAVAITMDDGHISNYTVACKELKKKHWPGAIFVVVKNVDADGSGNGEWLTWKQIRKMSGANIAVLSHSYNGHRFVKGQYPNGDAWLTTPLPGESKTGYRQRIYRDLLKSRLMLQQHLNKPVESFALPFGMYNQDVIDMAQKAGYKNIWTTVPQAVSSTSTLNQLPRVSAGRKNTTAQQLRDTIIAIGQR